MGHLSIALLGGFSVTLDGAPLTSFGTDKARALLAYLAVEAGRPHRRSSLSAIFWPDTSDEKAAHNLRQALLRLRRGLHDDETSPSQPLFVQLLGQDVQFNALSSYRLDVAEFRELLAAQRQHKHPGPDVGGFTDGCEVCMGWLRQAVDLYRGDLLAGFTVRDCEPFEEWRVVQQEALHGQAVDALGRLADYYERRGEHTRTLEFARRLVTLEPWQERARMQVMAVLAASGQEVAALEQYASYTRVLAEEFGVEPAPEVTALYERLSKQPSARVGGRPAPGKPPGEAGERRDQDERRQVTALVCRRVGAEAADPEELRELLAHCSRQCKPIIERHGGQHESRRGVDCLVCFGYPMAQEDAARRAVAAGLEIVDLTAREANSASDHLRIGVNTGIMVASGQELVGTVAEMAADCMRLAGPDSVLVTAETERVVHGWFDAEPLDAAGAGRLGVYRVYGGNPAKDRLARLAQVEQLTPLAGRHEELQQLSAALDASIEGRGKLVTLSGEPGIGKSRLLWELKQRYAGRVRWIESHCSPYFQNTSLHPIADHLRQLLGFAPDDDGIGRRDKLAAALEAAGLTQPASLRLMSLLLGLPTDTPAPLAITQEQRERMRETALALIEAETLRHPLVLAIEDLHWADPTSVTWIDRSIDDLPGVRCTMLLTWRPAFQPPWRPAAARRLGHEVSVELGPLEPGETAGMVAALTREMAVPAELRDQVVRQTDGIPLYVEELTQALVRNGANGGLATRGGSRLPPTLRDSLTARLDRAGAAKETALWGAALGRSFSHAILSKVTGFDERRLAGDLDVLLRLGVLTRQEVNGRPGYGFRHAMLQEAAYDIPLKRTRQAYHRRIAETLASGFLQLAEAQPEILAYHYRAAGLTSQAAEQWLAAAEHAMAQGATAEARAFFDQALAETEPEDLERRARMLLGRARVLNLLVERTAQRDNIEELLATADALGDDRLRVEAFQQQVTYAGHVDDYLLLLRASEGMLAAAARLDDATLEVQAMSSQIRALARLDRCDAASRLIDKIHVKLAGVADEQVRGRAFAATGFFYSAAGDTARAILQTSLAAEAFERSGDRYLQLRTLRNIAFYNTQLGLYEDARTLNEQALALAERIGDRNGQAINLFDLSYVYWCLGELERGGEIGEQLLTELRATGGNPLATANCLAALGLILQDAGELATAAAYFAEGHGLFATHSIDGSWIEVEALEAGAMLALGDREAAARLAAEVWTYVTGHGVVRLDYPSRVLSCVADVAASVDTLGVSEREVLDMGYRLLMQRAEAIENPGWRKSFLEHEVSNRGLIERWKRLQVARA